VHRAPLLSHPAMHVGGRSRYPVSPVRASLFFFNDPATTEIYTLSLHDALPIFDDVALGVCKTGAEEAGVTEVRTSLSEKKFELWREIKVRSEERRVGKEWRSRGWQSH